MSPLQQVQSGDADRDGWREVERKKSMDDRKIKAEREKREKGEETAREREILENIHA